MLAVLDWVVCGCGTCLTSMRLGIGCHMEHQERRLRLVSAPLWAPRAFTRRDGVFLGHAPTGDDGTLGE